MSNFEIAMTVGLATGVIFILGFILFSSKSKPVEKKEFNPEETVKELLKPKESPQSIEIDIEVMTNNLQVLLNNPETYRAAITEIFERSKILAPGHSTLVILDVDGADLGFITLVKGYLDTFSISFGKILDAESEKDTLIRYCMSVSEYRFTELNEAIKRRPFLSYRRNVLALRAIVSEVTGYTATMDWTLYKTGEGSPHEYSFAGPNSPVLNRVQGDTAHEVINDYRGKLDFLRQQLSAELVESLPMFNKTFGQFIKEAGISLIESIDLSRERTLPLMFGGNVKEATLIIKPGALRIEITILKPTIDIDLDALRLAFENKLTEYFSDYSKPVDFILLNPIRVEPDIIDSRVETLDYYIGIKYNVYLKGAQ